MAVLKICVLLLAIAVSATTGALLQLPKTKSCLNDGECGSGECCAKQLGPLIMSRRRDAFTTPDPATVEGTCKPYLKHGEWCGGVWTQNGFCGCAPSLTCHRYPPVVPVTRRKRKMLAGTYLCEPKEMGP
ncbi:uncharacterized protein LOC124145150 [Haliotis rufescens]|uniref:uncharacterized protein LOC124145150 n=1 Tax=Haliotis rufescens TaxID=6454 RepID=UPI00201EC11D|nr:uncharacterized protein LOC124145150 [Haliotis rufescens]